MPMIRANIDDLYQQAIIHQKLAAFYRQAHEQIAIQGGAIVRALREAQRYADADQYQQWLTDLAHLLEEATSHDSWSDYFLRYANALQSLESTLAGSIGETGPFRRGSHWIE